jgi:hypothetical protein
VQAVQRSTASEKLQLFNYSKMNEYVQFACRWWMFRLSSIYNIGANISPNVTNLITPVHTKEASIQAEQD